MISIRDLIQDNIGRECIVVAGLDEPPDAGWIRMQNDMRVRQLPQTEAWWKAYPLTGGSVYVPQSLAQFIRKANRDDVNKALEGANEYGRKILKSLFDHFPDLPAG